MNYYKTPDTGDVFAFETPEEREQFGLANLVQMTDEEVAAYIHPTVVPQVPQSVTMRQARLALLGAGLLDDVNSAIAAIADDAQRRAAEIEWEYAATVDRASPFTQQLASGLGLTSEQLDSLFTQAAAL